MEKFSIRKSIETNVTEFVEFVNDSFDEREQVDVVYNDFIKAFDKISHQILIDRPADESNEVRLMLLIQ